MSEPTITLPLNAFLDILWGYKDKVDRRDKAVPCAAVTEALRAVPAEHAAGRFHIQNPTGEEGLAVIWQLDEWRRSGFQEQETKKECAAYNFQTDKLTDWLMVHCPVAKVLGRAAMRATSHVIVTEDNWSNLKPFGLTDEQIQTLKAGTY